MTLHGLIVCLYQTEGGLFFSVFFFLKCLSFDFPNFGKSCHGENTVYVQMCCEYNFSKFAYLQRQCVVLLEYVSPA